MGIFDIFKKKKSETIAHEEKKTEPNTEKLDFTGITTQEDIVQLIENGFLVPLYLMPLRFHGEPILQNTLYVPPFVVVLKDRYDTLVENLLLEGKVTGYSCSPKYRGESRVPKEITISATKEEIAVFTQTIHIW